MGVCEIDLDAVDGLSLVFFFGLEHELLEDGVVAGDNAEEGEGLVSLLIREDKRQRCCDPQRDERLKV